LGSMFSVSAISLIVKPVISLASAFFRKITKELFLFLT
jgi:hypothetical protein